MTLLNPYLFEVSCEVANKVGGIYTVIKTKTAVTVDEYGDKYYLLGPYSHQKASMEVEEKEPSCQHVKAAVNAMRSAGVRVVTGTWLVEGAPNVILFDLGSVSHRLNEWKVDLWETSQIPSPENDKEMNDSILFGYCIAWFFGEVSYRIGGNTPLIAHFHEWLASVGLVLCRKRRISVATIFTTHATLLGRYLCAGNADFYNNISHFNEDAEAGKRGIYHRYCLERAAAHCAHVFTTVSHITAYESEHLLKRKPDGVLPNGLNCTKFSTMHELHNRHNENKEKITAFVQGHFYGHTDFDPKNTLYFFTAGRYEFRNKGVDLYLESLARINTYSSPFINLFAGLNHRLKLYNSATTVVAFIIMPAATNNYNVEALKGQAVTKQLQDAVDQITDRIGSRIYDNALRGNVISRENILQEEDVVHLKRHMLALKRDTLPPVVTHNMQDSGSDPILMELRRLNLFNSPSDRVKIVFHPEFLSSHNPVLGIEYEDFVRGCHLGVFPSYYEPWGYTPAECTVLGIPSVTTNLSGFGCFIEENVENPSDYGIYVVDRRMKSVEESVQQLTEYFVKFCSKSRRQRINLRNRTERLSDLLDWTKMGLEYGKARQLALKRMYPDLFENSSIAQLNNDEGIDNSSNIQIGEPPLIKIPRPMSTLPSPNIHSSFDQEEAAECEDIPVVDIETFGKLQIV